jgi:CBS domain-containing protein
VAALVDAGAPTVSDSSRLDVALDSLTAAPESWVPVLDDERRVVGTLSISDVVRAYRQELVSSAERMSDLGAMTGTAQVTITPTSPMAGKTLRQAELPAGLLITSISRGDRVFFPTGNTKLEVGDRLTVIGQGFDLTQIGKAESVDASE